MSVSESPINNDKKKDITHLINSPLEIDGLELLDKISDETISTVFFDPQYRGILDKQNYGNEGKNREKRRVNLKQMTEEKIIEFIHEIDRVLKPSGHLFLWVDKFHLCEGIQEWFMKTKLQTVDLVTWVKPRIGMGYRTRNKCEYLMIFQKKPLRAKGVWTVHNIPNFFEDGFKKDSVKTKIHPHTKPVLLQQELINATNRNDDIVLDPAMGSGSVFEACKNLGINFIGGDIHGSFE